MPFQVVRDERGMLHRLKFFFLLLCDTSKMVNFNYLLFARVDARNKLIMRQDTYVYCGVRAARDWRRCHANTFRHRHITVLGLPL